MHRSATKSIQHSKKADQSANDPTTMSKDHQGTVKKQSIITAEPQTNRLWVSVTREKYRDLQRMPMALNEKRTQEALNIAYYVPEREVHSSLRHHNRYPAVDGKQTATRSALFTDHLSINLVVDHSNNKLKKTRSRNLDSFCCGE